MKNINIHKLYYHFRHRYLTRSNAVIVIALMISASWVWGSIGMMQRNYGLQKEIDGKLRQRELTNLQVKTLSYEQKYYKSNEYKELSAREHLRLVDPGEKILILPPNSASVKKADEAAAKKLNRRVPVRPSNFQQWVNFLFGGNSRGLQK